MSFLPPVFADGAPTLPAADVAALQYRNTYAFDFATGQFVQDPGTAPDDPVVVLADEDSLTQRLDKALRTKRYSFLVYTHAYGTEWIAAAEAGGTNDVTFLALIQSEAAETLLHDRLVRTIVSVAAVLDDPLAPTVVTINWEVVDTFGATITGSTTVTL